MGELAPTEIQALARILGDLDYYQLLDLPTDASVNEVRKAYHATSRAFHPDGNRHHQTGVRDAIDQIAKRITEAYSVLRDPRRRRAYDQRLSSGGGNRIQLSESRVETDREVTERQGLTPQGRQYFNIASAEMRQGNWAAAVRSLQTALTFEPGNESFKSRLAEAKHKHNHS